MKKQVFASYKGVSYQNETYPLVGEYITRQRLAKLGYQSDMSKLPYWKAEAFALIGSEIDRLQNDDMKKRSKKG